MLDFLLVLTYTKRSGNLPDGGILMKTVNTPKINLNRLGAEFCNEVEKTFQKDAFFRRAEFVGVAGVQSKLYGKIFTIILGMIASLNKDQEKPELSIADAFALREIAYCWIEQDLPTGVSSKSNAELSARKDATRSLDKAKFYMDELFERIKNEAWAREVVGDLIPAKGGLLRAKVLINNRTFLSRTRSRRESVCYQYLKSKYGSEILNECLREMFSLLGEVVTLRSTAKNWPVNVAKKRKIESDLQIFFDMENDHEVKTPDEILFWSSEHIPLSSILDASEIITTES